jgi:hypothetical protein
MRYMSDEKSDAVYGRLCREISALNLDSALLESEIKRIGQNLEGFGKQLQNLLFGSDQTLAETDMQTLWVTIQEYQDAQMELSDKKGQLEKIDNA